MNVEERIGGGGEWTPDPSGVQGEEMADLAVARIGQGGCQSSRA